MKKIHQEQINQKDRFSSRVIMLLLGLVMFLSIVRVFAANATVEASENLRKLDLEATRLEQENLKVAQEIRSLTAGSFVEKKALELGFTKGSHFVYLSVTPEVAFNK